MPSVNITQIAASDVAIAENRKSLSNSLAKHGSSAQITASLVEAGELIRAIANTQHAMRGSSDIHEAVEDLSREMADIKIMLAQLSMIFDNDMEVARLVHERCSELQSGTEASDADETENFGSDWEMVIGS